MKNINDLIKPQDLFKIANADGELVIFANKVDFKEGTLSEKKLFILEEFFDECRLWHVVYTRRALVIVAKSKIEDAGDMYRVRLKLKDFLFGKYESSVEMVNVLNEIEKIVNTGRNFRINDTTRAGARLFSITGDGVFTQAMRNNFNDYLNENEERLYFMKYLVGRVRTIGCHSWFNLSSRDFKSN